MGGLIVLECLVIRYIVVEALWLAWNSFCLGGNFYAPRQRWVMLYMLMITRNHDERIVRSGYDELNGDTVKE